MILRLHGHSITQANSNFLKHQYCSINGQINCQTNDLKQKKDRLAKDNSKNNRKN